MYNNESYKSHEDNIIKMVGDTDFEEFRRSYFDEGLTTSWLVILDIGYQILDINRFFSVQLYIQHLLSYI